jgi:hypothetical protein
MSQLTEPRAVRRWRPTRVLVTLVVVGMAAMWGYVLYLAFGPGRQAPPDRLDDPAFAIAAEARCHAALEEVDELPSASASASATERADVVDEANEIFAAMLDDLAVLTPSGEDGSLVRQWLADWRTYLGDRQEYAHALRSDPRAQLLVSAKDRDQITEYLDAFAADNRMTACATPLDV